MGQYYTCITEDDYGVTKYSMQRKGFDWASADSWKMYIGLKLMEHSYIGNALTDSISHSLYHHPMRVAWVGDYAGDLTYEYIKCLNPDFPIVKGAYNTFLKEALHGEGVDFETKKGKFDYKGKYLINYSKKEYLSFDKYIEKISKNYDTRGWIIYPVSLLTAIGNDLGGGCYGGKHLMKKLERGHTTFFQSKMRFRKDIRKNRYYFFNLNIKKEKGDKKDE